MKDTLILCAGNGEDFDFATPIGVGLINSAINLTRILEQASMRDELPKQIVFVGTCGLYNNSNLNNKLDILDIFESDFVTNIEISALLDLAYSPLHKNIEKVSYETLAVNCSNFITTNADISAHFAELGFVGENMEFFSVKKVAESFAIPAKAILCATNYCDKSAHENFIKNHAKAKEKLINYIKERKLK